MQVLFLGELRFAVRSADCITVHRRPGAPLLGANLKYFTKAVQLQRDTQQKGCAWHYLCTMYSRPAGNIKKSWRHASEFTPMRNDNPKGSGATLQEFSGRQHTSATT